MGKKELISLLKGFLDYVCLCLSVRTVCVSIALLFMMLVLPHNIYNRENVAYLSANFSAYISTYADGMCFYGSVWLMSTWFLARFQPWVSPLLTCSASDIITSLRMRIEIEPGFVHRDQKSLTGLIDQQWMNWQFGLTKFFYTHQKSVNFLWKQRCQTQVLQGRWPASAESC